MKIYEVEYIKNNKKNKIKLSAENRAQAINIAKKSGTITKIGEIKSTSLSVQFEEGKDKILNFISGSKVKTPNLIASIRQLAVMINAGIPITDSIKEIVASSEDKKLKNIFASVNEMLDNGQNFADSMEKYKDQVGDIVIAMIRLGENTGKLAESLNNLANILDDVWKNKQNVKKALRYPTIVIIAIAGAFTFLMLVIVPKFKAIFDELGANLPLPTILLLKIEYVLSNYGIFILAALFLAFVFAKHQYKTNDKFRAYFDTFIINKVYLIKNILFYSSMYRFNLIFGELINAGIPISKALNTATMTIPNFYINKKLSSVSTSIQNGKNFTQSIKETELYESMLVQMIKAGELGGNLEGMMEKVTAYYKTKFDDIIENISSYIEPILILAIAAMVVLLALGIFMPMWDLGSAVRS
ncbi:type II secretion system F family protein [Campylobacter sputorum]|uniref:Type II secretion system protein n=1 Tax=Campylobacter sputorum subsp. sputorum TaxID=32024 RepID=A0A381DHM8_9BACT|nr:type II secretion system F family protein [Campylobacter sputorum]ASM35168.1 transformation system, type II secretion system membrane protein CtsF [Campylobacter sputorum aubsp. sputorum RM3237]ASM36840.1 transformation system, type II secretion system membrane protein CtsF [Campylobacter sputorum bv. faecalis CCUG 20703]KAB0581026.1 type II secretion system F family protein [Campylobacter sputorum subsp. sputorum]QEL05357.1 transformation system, membrane protein CtsF [Campylobacter sputoru